MKDSNPPQKHHYIPAFYLRRWVAADRKVTEFTRPVTNKIAIKRVTPEYTGFQDRLYELKGYEARLAQQVEEKFFKVVDGWAAQSLDLLERFEDRAPWDAHRRSAWSRFILSLLLRCPEDIDIFRSTWREDFERTDADQELRYQEVRGPEDPETFAEFLANQPLTLKERHQFQILLSLVDHAEVGGKINAMEWRVLRMPDHAPTLLTSDRPVIRTNGLAQKGGHLALPIGPKLLFLASHDPDFLQAILQEDQVKLAKESNRNVVESASRFVYGIDDKQRRFIQNRMGLSPQLRLMESIFRQRQEARR